MLLGTNTATPRRAFSGSGGEKLCCAIFSLQLPHSVLARKRLKQDGFEKYLRVRTNVVRKRSNNLNILQLGGRNFCRARTKVKGKLVKIKVIKNKFGFSRIRTRNIN